MWGRTITTAPDGTLFGPNADGVPDLKFYSLKVDSPEFAEKQQACLGGGGAGRAKFYAQLYIDAGGQIMTAMYRGRLGVEVTIVDLTARASGELLKVGVGREIHLESSTLSGVIIARLQQLMIECKREGWRWKCKHKWVTKLEQKIWGWNSGFSTGNLLCRVPAGTTVDKCRDQGHDCCAHETLGQSPACAPGYVVVLDKGGHPTTAADCTNPHCFGVNQVPLPPALPSRVVLTLHRALLTSSHLSQTRA